MGGLLRRHLHLFQIWIVIPITVSSLAVLTSPSEIDPDSADPELHLTTSRLFAEHESNNVEPSALLSPSPSPRQRPRRTPSPQPTQRAYESWNEPDGKPGWSGGFSGCNQSPPIANSVAPSESLTIELMLPQAEYAAGEVISAEVELKNTGSSNAQLTVIDSSDDGTLIDNRGDAVSAVYWSDAVMGSNYEIPPGGSKRIKVSVQTSSCGDTGDEPPRNLAKGNYEVSVHLSWSSKESGPNEWYAPMKPVSLV